MCDSKQRPPRVEIGNERGFTLIEVLISIAITLVVMASVFALLTRGQRSFEREPQIADLQQNARNVLDMVSRDILQTGAPACRPSSRLLPGKTAPVMERLPIASR